MRFPDPSLPPLPADWPFEPRPVLSAPLLRDSVSLPSLGEGWSLMAQADLPLGEETLMGGAFGRGGIQRHGEVVLRPYRRGGLVRFMNKGIYPSPVRFAAEFAVHHALWQSGFPTVEPLGYGWRRRYWGYEGVFLTRFATCEPWPRHWHESLEVIPNLKRLLEALCDWGLHAPDLNATNVMVRDGGEVLLLDWDRAAWDPTVRLIRYQSRLLRSLAKLGAPREIIAEIDRWQAP